MNGKILQNWAVLLKNFDRPFWLLMIHFSDSKNEGRPTLFSTATFRVMLVIFILAIFLITTTFGFFVEIGLFEEIENFVKIAISASSRVIMIANEYVLDHHVLEHDFSTRLNW